MSVLQSPHSHFELLSTCKNNAWRTAQIRSSMQVRQLHKLIMSNTIVDLSLKALKLAMNFHAVALHQFTDEELTS